MDIETNLEVFMEEENQQQRILAVERFENGESPESICTSLGKSKAWLYKWIGRYLENDDSWNESRSRRPLTVSNYTPAEIEEIVKIVRSIFTTRIFSAAPKPSTGNWKNLA